MTFYMNHLLQTIQMNCQPSFSLFSLKFVFFKKLSATILNGASTVNISAGNYVHT